MTFFLAALAAAQPAAPPLVIPAPWATFSRTPALRRRSEKVEVGTYRGGSRGAPLQFLLRRTLTDRGQTTVSWTTTLACPGARDALAAMERISASPDVPGLGVENDTMILDGVGYVLDAPNQMRGGAGRLRISSNVETPLAAWVDSTMRVLEPCWSDKAPGRP